MILKCTYHSKYNNHYIDAIMTTMASQITSLTVVYATVYSDTDQRKHQGSKQLALVWGIHRDRGIPRTKGQLRGKCFHLMTSSWKHSRTTPHTSPFRASYGLFFRSCTKNWPQYIDSALYIMHFSSTHFLNNDNAGKSISLLVTTVIHLANEIL